jgi:hypothetical protein
MKISEKPLKSKYETVAEVKRAVKAYASDLKDFPEIMSMNVSEYFDFVKNIPYKKDVPDTEVVSRPAYLLTMFPSLDCKKKSILFASFMRVKYGPKSYRFVISSNRPDGQIGHIFTQIFNGNRWINADVTYSHNALGKPKRVTNYEIVGG